MIAAISKDKHCLYLVNPFVKHPNFEQLTFLPRLNFATKLPESLFFITKFQNLKKDLKTDPINSLFSNLLEHLNLTTPQK
jgi:hypothetical protein